MKLIIISWCVLLLLFAAISNSYACEKNVIKVAVGNPAPCVGWHVSDSKMQDFAKETDQLQLAKDLNKVNEQLIRLNETEIDYFRQKSKSRAKELEQAEKRQFWHGVGMFTLGVVLTGVAAKAAIEVSK